MLWIALAILNIPVYLFLGWLVFDSKEKAADSFGETILMLVQQIFVPRIVRILTGMDEEGAGCE